MLPIPISILLLAVAVGLYLTGLHFALAPKRTVSEDILGILMVAVATMITVAIVVDCVATWRECLI